MPCFTSEDRSLTICRPTLLRSRTRVLWCPKCKQRRRVTVHSFERYGSHSTCKAPRLKWAHFKPCGYLWQWE